MPKFVHYWVSLFRLPAVQSAMGTSYQIYHTTLKRGLRKLQPWMHSMTDVFHSVGNAIRKQRFMLDGMTGCSCYIIYSGPSSGASTRSPKTSLPFHTHAFGVLASLDVVLWYKHASTRARVKWLVCQKQERILI